MGLKDDNINLQINIGVSGAAANIQKLNDENMKLASSTNPYGGTQGTRREKFRGI